jgi:arylsulfatase A-like enzyme
MIQPASSALYILALLPASLSACARFGGPTDDRPDVVLVLVDALRADRMGLSGLRAIPRLEAESVVYDRAFAQGVETRTAMPVLLGGLDGPRWLGTRFPGYDRVAFLANDWLGPPLTDGFEVHDLDYTYAPGKERVDGEDLTNDFLAWLEGHPGPVLAWLHYMDVHAPYACPKHPAKWRPLTMNGPIPPEFTEKDIELTRRCYDDAVRSVDQQLGRLLDALDARKRPDLIVVTADHGEALGEHDLLGHGTRAIPEVVRIPLIVREPDRVPRHVRDPIAEGEIVHLLSGEPVQTNVPFLVQNGAKIDWPLLETHLATYNLETGDEGVPWELDLDFSRFPAYRPPLDAAGNMKKLGYVE